MRQKLGALAHVRIKVVGFRQHLEGTTKVVHEKRQNPQQRIGFGALGYLADGIGAIVGHPLEVINPEMCDTPLDQFVVLRINCVADILVGHDPSLYRPVRQGAPRRGSPLGVVTRMRRNCRRLRQL